MSDRQNIVGLVKDWIKKNYHTDNHLIRAEYWLKKLKPGADEAMVIAAITHDIERAFPEGRNPPLADKWNDKKYALWHGQRSADFVEKFLSENGFSDEEIIEKIKQLVAYHELGGDREKDLIKDADSVSFFENNIPLFLSFIPSRDTKEGIREKFDYMFNRISSQKAKKLAEPFYRKAIGDLKKVK